MSAVTRGALALDRITSHGRLLPELEVLRFYSLALIVLFHLNFALSRRVADQASWAWLSAEIERYAFHALYLFFTISGFIIALPFARAYVNNSAPPSLRAFYWRRLTRIEPPYIVSLMILFAYAILAGGADPRDLLPHLLASLTYTHNVIYGTNSAINVVAWSLEIEVQFYVVAPFFCQIFRVRRDRWRRALIVVAILLSGSLVAFTAMERTVFGVTLFRYLHFFLAGLLLCDIFTAGWKESPRLERRFDWLYVAGLAMALLAARSSLGSSLVFPFATVVYYLGVFRSSTFNPLYQVRSFALIGGMCYSIYLYHVQIISFLGERGVFAWVSGHTYPVAVALAFVMVSVPVVFICGTHFALIERPCMVRDWPQKLWRRLRPGGSRARAAAGG